MSTWSASLGRQSVALVSQMRSQRLRDIFNLLGPDSDGIVDGSAVALKLSMLPKDVMEALSPLVPSFRGEFAVIPLMSFPLPTARPYTRPSPHHTSANRAGEYFTFSEFKHQVQRSLADAAPNGPRLFLHPSRGARSAYAKGREDTLRRKFTRPLCLHATLALNPVHHPCRRVWSYRQQQTECTFKPKLGQRSEQLAAALRPPGKAITEVSRQALVRNVAI